MVGGGVQYCLDGQTLEVTSGKNSCILFRFQDCGHSILIKTWNCVFWLGSFFTARFHVRVLGAKSCWFTYPICILWSETRPPLPFATLWDGLTPLKEQPGPWCGRWEVGESPCFFCCLHITGSSPWTVSSSHRPCYCRALGYIVLQLVCFTLRKGEIAVQFCFSRMCQKLSETIQDDFLNLEER